MKLLTTIPFVMFLSTAVTLAGCNLMQTIKDTGDAVGEGAEAVVEAAKKAPKAIGDASNKIEADIRKKQ
jgi:predicted small secreted protein